MHADEIRRILGIDDEKLVPEPKTAASGIIGAGDVIETSDGKICVVEYALHGPTGAVVLMSDGVEEGVAWWVPERPLVPLLDSPAPLGSYSVLAETMMAGELCQLVKTDEGEFAVLLGQRTLRPREDLARPAIVLYSTGPADPSIGSHPMLLPEGDY